MLGTYISISALVLLNGFFIYRIQHFIRTHRTWELAFMFACLGLGSIAVSQSQSIPPNFRLTFYVLFSSFLILLSFEPELAHFFHRLAQSLNPKSRNRKRNAIHEIAQAAATLSASKTGALIAFERSDSLLKFGESGIEINADIKKELLMTLFFKDTATHDGGLLIRDGRATHCGAVFPLSERRQMENGLGTRHRAALGLSEKTDAVCLVVSEEEGTISLAQDGELFYDIPAKQLEAQLSQSLSGTGRFKFYPFHYIKHLSPKLVQANYIQFTKSWTEKIYEGATVFFFATLFVLLDAVGIFKIADLNPHPELLLNRPWVLVPAVLLMMNAVIFLSARIVSINGINNEVKIQHRFLLFPVWTKMMTKENLKGVTLKHEKIGSNLWSLLLFHKKKRTYLLDRSTSAKSLSEDARRIKDVLRF